MPKNKTSEWSETANSNSDIGGVNIAEGCSPANINNAARTIMSQIATARTGSDDGIVTGTAGADGTAAVWNVDGDLVEGSATIPANAVGTTQIVDDAVTVDKIATPSGDATTVITGTAGAESRLAEWDALGNAGEGPAYGTGANELVQLTGTGALPAVDGSNLTGLTDLALGVGQTWQEMLAAGPRAVATSYQNTTGRPIGVAIVSSGSTTSIDVSVDDATWIRVGTVASAAIGSTFFIVPDQSYYRVAGGSLTSWAELR